METLPNKVVVALAYIALAISVIGLITNNFLFVAYVPLAILLVAGVTYTVVYLMKIRRHQ
ncbi:hypothetical protein [Acidihalobacter ferrooxydans]|uniref:hypothetical protein n=1 Tax=Acidihalobacter ferrooxydans TaxID=1765967 RepID=UPI0012EC2B76|nr:hypothetical protein [Acidihalobacter ferrooxydans]